MLIYSACIIAGLILLIWSADRFLSGAAATAKGFGISPLLIGLTVVSLGTSAPEIVVSVMASLQNTPNIAIGNAIGSNIANIGLVLGITALFRPLPFPKSVLTFELPWLIAVTFIAFLFIADNQLTRLEGVALVLGLGILLWQIARRQKNNPDDWNEGLLPEEGGDDASEKLTKKPIWLFLSGLVVLLLSAELLVWSATGLAREMNVSELVIGLTIVAIGTSLPELAATVGAALRGQTGLAIGNVVGSNILNILAVLAIPALLRAPGIPPEILWRDFLTMSALTLLLMFFAYGLKNKPSISRFEGVVLTIFWFGYNALLYYLT